MQVVVDLRIYDQDEIIRVIDSLQLGDKHRITTPVNWKKGDDVIVHPSVSNEEAKKLFPDFTTHTVSLARGTVGPCADKIIYGSHT